MVQCMVEEVEAAQGVEHGFWALWEAYARLAWAMLHLEQAVFGSVSVMVNSLCLCASDGTCSFWCMFCQHLLTLSRNRYIIDRGTISNM